MNKSNSEDIYLEKIKSLYKEYVTCKIPFFAKICRNSIDSICIEYNDLVNDKKLEDKFDKEKIDGYPFYPFNKNDRKKLKRMSLSKIYQERAYYVNLIYLLEELDPNDKIQSNIKYYRYICNDIDKIILKKLKLM